MKFFKKLSALIISLCLIIQSGSIANASDIHLSASDIENIMKSQKSAVEAYNVMMKSFCDANYNIVYPESYSGAYIEDNLLVILLNSEYKDEAINYYNLLKDFDCIKIQLAKYSYNYLTELASKTAHELLKDYPVSANYVDVKNNSVVIEIAENEEGNALQTLNKQKSNYNLPSVISVTKGEYISDNASLINGSQILSRAGGGYTLGVSGTWNGRTVLVTAGHGNMDLYTQVRLGSTNDVLGTVVFRQYATAQPGDFAFIELTNANYTNTSLVYRGVGSSSPFLGTANFLPVGAYVYRWGHTSGECYAQINSLVEAGGTETTTNITRATIITGSSAAGDSGGPVRYGDSFCGIHKGSDSSNIYFTQYHWLQAKGFTALVN